MAGAGGFGGYGSGMSVPAQHNPYQYSSPYAWNQPAPNMNAQGPQGGGMWDQQAQQLGAAVMPQMPQGGGGGYNMPYRDPRTRQQAAQPWAGQDSFAGFGGAAQQPAIQPFGGANPFMSAWRQY